MISNLLIGAVAHSSRLDGCGGYVPASILISKLAVCMPAGLSMHIANLLIKAAVCIDNCCVIFPSFQQLESSPVASAPMQTVLLQYYPS